MVQDVPLTPSPVMALLQHSTWGGVPLPHSTLSPNQAFWIRPYVPRIPVRFTPLTTAKNPAAVQGAARPANLPPRSKNCHLPVNAHYNCSKSFNTADSAINMSKFIIATVP